MLHDTHNVKHSISSSTLQCMQQNSSKNYTQRQHTYKILRVQAPQPLQHSADYYILFLHRAPRNRHRHDIYALTGQDWYIGEECVRALTRSDVPLVVCWVGFKKQKQKERCSTCPTARWQRFLPQLPNPPAQGEAGQLQYIPLFSTQYRKWGSDTGHRGYHAKRITVRNHIAPYHNLIDTSRLPRFSL